MTQLLELMGKVGLGHAPMEWTVLMLLGLVNAENLGCIKNRIIPNVPGYTKLHGQSTSSNSNQIWYISCGICAPQDSAAVSANLLYVHSTVHHCSLERYPALSAGTGQQTHTMMSVHDPNKSSYLYILHHFTYMSTSMYLFRALKKHQTWQKWLLFRPWFTKCPPNHGAIIPPNHGILTPEGGCHRCSKHKKIQNQVHHSASTANPLVLVELQQIAWLLSESRRDFQSPTYPGNPHLEDKLLDNRGNLIDLCTLPFSLKLVHILYCSSVCPNKW